MGGGYGHTRSRLTRRTLVAPDEIARSPLGIVAEWISMRLLAFCVITPAGVIAPPTGPSEGSEKPGCPAAGHGVGSRRRIQFAIDTLEMGLERVHRNEKLACDLPSA